MGCSFECFDFVVSKGHYAKLCFVILGLLFLVLYLLDFFAPPHLPGQYLVLFNKDRVVGKSVMAVAIACCFVGCLLMAKHYPFVPVIMTTFLSPAAMFLIRALMTPYLPIRSLSVVARAPRNEQMKMLIQHTLKERDQYYFYSAASAAFVLTASGCLLTWVLWAVKQETLPEEAKTEHGEDVFYILWVSPLAVAVSNYVFGLVVAIRVYLSMSYSATSEKKNRLVLEGDLGEMSNSKRLVHHRVQLEQPEKGLENKSRILKTVHGVGEAVGVHVKPSNRMEHHVAHTRRLLNVMKLIGSILLFKMGVLYIVFQLVATDSSFALMLQGFLGAFFVFFCCFTLLAFRRLWRTMGDKLLETHLFKKCIEVTRANWFRAAAIMVLFPLLPPILALSALNEVVRRLRGFDRVAPPPVSEPSDDGQSKPKSRRFLTHRMSMLLAHMSWWDKIPILLWLYAISVMVVTVMLAPRLLNIFLAWVTGLLQDLGFGLLLVVTFCIGLVMFLLPPVPGAPIYFFSGALFTQSCPWGFMWGSVISVMMSWSLKLAACAMQQKLIGERLGNYQYIQRTCGVHKPFIRTIESVLRKPGMSLGKVSILCGGPDWPTSVLAGILKLSLLQMELGTLPIIFFVAPFSLSGSFYLKREDGEIWIRSGNLMFAATALVCVVLWGFMAWAWQEEYDVNHFAATRPMAKYLQLDWLDHRETMIGMKCEVYWPQVPGILKAFFLLGSCAMVCVTQAFWWMMNNCFSSFAVTDDISTLRLYGEGGFLKLYGIVGMAAFMLSMLPLVVFLLWRRAKVRGPAAAMAAELDASEAAWKEQRMEAVREADRSEAGCASPIGSTVGSCTPGMPHGSSPKLENYLDQVDVHNVSPMKAKSSFGKEFADTGLVIPVLGRTFDIEDQDTDGIEQYGEPGPFLFRCGDPLQLVPELRAAGLAGLGSWCLACCSAPSRAADQNAYKSRQSRSPHGPRPMSAMPPQSPRVRLE